MADFLFDTNHACALVTLNHPVRAQVFDTLIAGHNFHICIPTLTEIMAGIGMLPRSQENLSN